MKINIVRQDTLKFRRVQRIKRINLIVTFGSIGLFALSVLWTSGQFVYLGYRGNQLTKTVKTLNDLYTARSKDEAEYLAVKQIIDTVDQIQGKRFKYRDFLNGIYQLLPSNAKLSGVDFGQSGVIIVNIRIINLTDYDTLLANINQGLTNNNFLFSAIAQSSLQRDKTGQYSVNLELKIK